MAIGQYHYAMHCLTFPVDRGKVRQAKIRKIKTQIILLKESLGTSNALAVFLRRISLLLATLIVSFMLISFQEAYVVLRM